MASVIVDRTGGQVEMPVAKGATWHDTVTVYSDAAQTTPQNLTGYTFQMQVRNTSDESGTLVYTATPASASPLTGVITWSVPATTTDDLTESVYWAELWWDSGTVREPLLRYQFKVRARVTAWV
jgi:hypothetical protein